MIFRKTLALAFPTLTGLALLSGSMLILTAGSCECWSAEAPGRVYYSGQLMPSNKALAAEDIETIRKSVELRLDFTDEKGIYVLSDKTERKRLDAIKDWLILHVKVFQEHRAERNTMAIFYSAPAWDKVYQDNVSMSFALNGTSLDQPEIALKDLKKIVLDPALGPVPALSRGSIFKGLRPPLPMK